MAKQLIYRLILGALVEHEAGLKNAALVVWLHASRYVSKKTIHAYLHRLQQVKWVMLEAGIWKATELGKQAYARNFLLSRALQGKDPELAVVIPVATPEPPTMQEIGHFPREWMPKRSAEVAWLYRAGVRV